MISIFCSSALPSCLGKLAGQFTKDVWENKLALTSITCLNHQRYTRPHGLPLLNPDQSLEEVGVDRCTHFGSTSECSSHSLRPLGKHKMTSRKGL